MKRRLNKWHSLHTLLDAGVTVDTVIDVGVQRDSADMRGLFPDHRHLLFEPVADYHEEIANNYRGMRFDLHKMALTDRNGPMYLEDVRHDEDGVVSHVQVAGHADARARLVEGRTLDSVLHQLWQEGRIAGKPYLIKIDVDGHELEVMRGARDALTLSACLVVETTLAGLADRCLLAEKAGLQLWDIVDLSFYRGCLYQADLVFVSQAILRAHATLDPATMLGSGRVRHDWWYSHQAD